MSFISILPKPKSRKKNFSIWQRWKCSFLVEEKPARCFASSRDLSMAEFILETNYPSRRIIHQTDNSSKYKFEDEFWRIFCLHIRYALRELDDWCFDVEPRKLGDRSKTIWRHSLSLWLPSFLPEIPSSMFFEFLQIPLHLRTSSAPNVPVVWAT